jgi:hypothetical protein
MTREPWEEPTVLADSDCERLLQPGQSVDSTLGEALRVLAALDSRPALGEAAALAAFRVQQAGQLPTAARRRSDVRRVRFASRAAALSLSGLVAIVGGAAAAAETGVVPNFVHPMLVHLHLESPHHGPGAPPSPLPPGNGTHPISPGGPASSGHEPARGLASSGRHHGNGDTHALQRVDEGRGHAYGNPSTTRSSAPGPSAPRPGNGRTGESSPGANNGHRHAHTHAPRAMGRNSRAGTQGRAPSTSHGEPAGHDSRTSQGKRTPATKPPPTPLPSATGHTRQKSAPPAPVRSRHSKLARPSH